LLVTVPVEVVELAVMTVVPVFWLVTKPLPLLRPLLIVATLGLDVVQVTALVISWLLDILA